VKQVGQPIDARAQRLRYFVVLVADSTGALDSDAVTGSFIKTCRFIRRQNSPIHCSSICASPLIEKLNRTDVRAGSISRSSSDTEYSVSLM
jgi:hypothetical protein